MYEKGKIDARKSDLAASAVSSTNPEENSLDVFELEKDYAHHSADSVMDHNNWYADSSATRHMTDRRSVFSTFQPIKPGTRPIKGIGRENKAVFALGIGDIKVKARVNGVWHSGIIQREPYVPD